MLLPAQSRSQTSTTASSTQPSSSDALEARLNDIDHRAGAVKDLTASFTQQKLTTLMKRPIFSTGVVRAKGSIVRWDTRSPDANVLYTDGKELRLYYPSQNLEEIYPIDQRLSDLLSSPLPRLAVVRDHFQIARAEPAVVMELLAGSGASPAAVSIGLLPLRLTPTDPALKEHVQQVIVLLDPKTSLVMAVQTTDSDGDKTTMVFSDVHLDTGLHPADLALVIPAGTSISHPLQGRKTPDSP
ncbi:MAG: outer membrane lipoprotein carrier protein LolA [Planctomycetota bacterium]|nr:outer membrane lipoprotein carrier protein LolA [Planctomycetota bacterium]